MRGLHRWLVNSPHKWPVTRKMFPFDDVITDGDHDLEWNNNKAKFLSNLITRKILLTKWGLVKTISQHQRVESKTNIHHMGWISCWYISVDNMNAGKWIRYVKCTIFEHRNVCDLKNSQWLLCVSKTIIQRYELQGDKNIIMSSIVIFPGQYGQR